LPWHHTCHDRYKAPFLAALSAEVAAGRLRRATSSLERFWAPLVEQEDAEWYARKTREEPADRAEGCLFAPGGLLAADGPPAEQQEAAAATATAAATCCCSLSSCCSGCSVPDNHPSQMI